MFDATHATQYAARVLPQIAIEPRITGHGSFHDGAVDVYFEARGFDQLQVFTVWLETVSHGPPALYGEW